MQELCPDDEAIVACVEEMMNKGVIRKTPVYSGYYATA
jgi:hypothetical protein